MTIVAEDERFILRLAWAMFIAYNEDGLNPWKSWDGRTVPGWNALNDSVRSKWVAAARKANSFVKAGGEGEWT